MRKRAFHILLFLLFTTLAICAAVTAGKKEASAAAVPEITAINVMDDAVELQISGDFTYTAYKPSDPFIVAVDLPDVGIGAFGGKITSDKAGFAEITVSGTKTPMATARLEILMDAPYEIESVRTDNSLLIKVKREAAAERPAAESAMQEEAEAPRQMVVAQASGVVEGAQEPLAPATRITNINFDYTNGMINLVIKGDGAMSPDVYTLKSRIIVDVPGVAMAAAIPAEVVAPVKAIRYGPYDGKSRLIIDLKEEVQFAASAVADTIVIALPADEMLEVMPTEAEVAEEAAVPPVETEPEDEDREYTGKIIDLDFQGANVVPIFRFIGDISGLNVVIHPNVSGNVTLKLKNVPSDQALDIILALTNNEQETKGNIMTIAKAGTLAKLATAKATLQKTEERTAVLVQRIIPLKHIDPAEMKKKILEDKASSPRGIINIDGIANSIRVTDTEDNIRKILKVVRDFDKPMYGAQQVMVEAKIILVTASYTKSVGINWDGSFGAQLLGTPLTGNFSINDPSGSGGSVDATIPSALAGSVISGSAPYATINLAVSALETIGDAKTLSNPRVLTLCSIPGESCEPANIVSGEQIPVSTTTAEGSTTEFVDANISLNVTPTITRRGFIKVLVDVAKSNPSTDPLNPGGIAAKSVTTTARVKDGETLVLGGVYEKTEGNPKTGIPGLRKIPILGWLFGSETFSDTTTELLILITPRVVKE
jgi:type IV pilus assembly protein PilQ